MGRVRTALAFPLLAIALWASEATAGVEVSLGVSSPRDATLWETHGVFPEAALGWERNLGRRFSLGAETGVRWSGADLHDPPLAPEGRSRWLGLRASLGFGIRLASATPIVPYLRGGPLLLWAWEKVTAEGGAVKLEESASQTALGLRGALGFRARWGRGGVFLEAWLSWIPGHRLRVRDGVVTEGEAMDLGVLGLRGGLRWP
jgi:hypothetical protein